MSQHHYQNKSWTDRNCHAVWRFARICHQLNIYWMNSVDVFAAVKIHQKHYRSCVTYLCTSRTTSNKPLSNGWLVLCVRDAKLSLLHLVLSWWKTWSKFRCCRKYGTIGSRILSLYLTAFNVPSTILNWVWPSREIPGQTITFPQSHPCSSLAYIIPDMSPIEHLLDELSRRVRRRQNSPEALQELFPF
jgi:hypothetical protein